MAGLTLLLETQKSRVSSSSSSKKSSDPRPQVLNKADMVRLCRSTPKRRGPAPPSASGFLEACFLCRKRLSPEKDIYMYRGDRGFCSVECRMRQMTMDEESVWMDNNKCGVFASTTASTSTSASASSSSPSSGRHRKSGAAKPRPAGVVNAGFAY